MSPINNSALSCIATAVGCTLTGMAVNEHFNPPPQAGPIPLGIQQNPPMDAEDLTVAASNGVEESVAPPEQMFTHDLTPSVEADNFSNLAPQQPEIWQQSPLDIGNLVVAARPLPRLERPEAKPAGNFSDEYFPDYLNFDGEGEAPEPIRVAMEELPQPEIVGEPMFISDFSSDLEPVPAPPPLFEGEAIVANYIVAPEAIIGNSFEENYPNNIVRQNRAIDPSPTQYIVEPQPQQARENSPVSTGDVSVSDSAKLAAQYVVEPRRVMAVSPGEQPEEISSNYRRGNPTVVEANNLPSPNPVGATNSDSNLPETAVISGVNSPPSGTHPRPKLLKKLVEPYQFPSEAVQDEEVDPVTYTPEKSQSNSDIPANIIEEKADIVVAVEPDFDTALEPIIEESEEETEQMPSLLKKLVESYSGSSDVLHDIKVSPPPLEASESKFARY